MRRNVLITAASRRVPLVNAFRKALADTGGGRVLVTDINGMSPAVHVADAAFRVPLATDPGYIEALEAICRDHQIGLLVPTIDDELEIIGDARSRLEASGIRVAASPTVTAAICNDKLRTSQVLRAHGLPAAESWLPGQVPSSVPFPLFVKPRNGRGGVGAFPAWTRRELDFFTEYVDQPIVQEYLDGPEFTIDMLCHEGRALAVVPRERVVIRAGVMDRGRTVRDRRLIDLGLACAATLQFHGAVNIQCSGIPLTIAAGADFARMLVDLAQGRTVAPRIGHFKDGLWMTCYEVGIFLSADQATILPYAPAAVEEVA
jgi:carbamoyl-phosphate synthase large subunit